MKASPNQGDNRTGFLAAGPRGDEMLQATREFPPSSPGSAQAIAEVRIARARESGPFGEMATLLDRLGERLAFEHAGARLYEALLSKHQAHGSFPGGPEEQDLLDILQEEYEHGDLLQQAIKSLGGDPTVLTPAANLAATISIGLPQVLSDPRTDLRQCLEAIAVAELADNECWSALETLARQAGQDELADQCRQAIEHEREHLRDVRRWIAAGQGRDPEVEGGAPPPDRGDEFTFAADSPVDREGYAVSEEEAADEPRPGRKPSKSRAPRRGR